MIALPAIAYAGQPFFRSAAQALSARRVNMDVPISLGVTLATLMSLYQTIYGSEHVYFDAAITLLFFLLVGRFLDQRMRVRAAAAAANLLGLRGTSATVIHADGTTSRLTARALAPGMRVLTAAGERFAVDGRVIEGCGEVDQSLITGETMPRTVNPGALIYAGTVNLSGPLVTEATATDQNTLLAEISRLMAVAEQARGRYVQARRPRRPTLRARRAPPRCRNIHRLDADRPHLGVGADGRHRCAHHHLSVRAGAGGAGRPSRRDQPTVPNGVLVKAPDGLERLAEIDTVVFDKTGTLTLGEPELVRSDDGQVTVIPDDILARAAAIAAGSRHPYARAVCRRRRCCRPDRASREQRPRSLRSRPRIHGR